MKGIQLVTNGLTDWSDRPLQGYYWMSEERDPYVQEQNKRINFSALTKEQDYGFIAEGMFYDEKNDISLVIKHIDSTQIVYSVDWKNLHAAKVEKLIAPAVRDPKSRYLVFKNIYQEIPSLTADGFSTLEFICRAFVGFQNNTH